MHQVALGKDGKCVGRIKDLDLALETQKAGNLTEADEWRIHFHVPLHASPGGDLGDTRIHVIDTLFWLSKNPEACRHLEMETYTWEVMPKELQAGTVVEQVAREYEWTLEQIRKIGLTQKISNFPPACPMASTFNSDFYPFPSVQPSHGMDELSGSMDDQSID